MSAHAECAICRTLGTPDVPAVYLGGTTMGYLRAYLCQECANRYGTQPQRDDHDWGGDDN